MADEYIHSWLACNNTKVNLLDEGVRLCDVDKEQSTLHFLELHSLC
jgi:hypothetical protein